MGLWLQHYATGMEAGALSLLTVYVTSQDHQWLQVRRADT